MRFNSNYNQNMMRTKISLSSCFMVMLIIILASSCEDPIDVELEDGGVQLVVDAWINNLERDQTIQLLKL